MDPWGTGGWHHILSCVPCFFLTGGLKIGQLWAGLALGTTVAVWLTQDLWRVGAPACHLPLHQIISLHVLPCIPSSSSCHSSAGVGIGLVLVMCIHANPVVTCGVIECVPGSPCDATPTRSSRGPVFLTNAEPQGMLQRGARSVVHYRDGGSTESQEVTEPPDKLSWSWFPSWMPIRPVGPEEYKVREGLLLFSFSVCTTDSINPDCLVLHSVCDPLGVCVCKCIYECVLAFAVVSTVLPGCVCASRTATCCSCFVLLFMTTASASCVHVFLSMLRGLRHRKNCKTSYSAWKWKNKWNRRLSSDLKKQTI